MGNIKKYISSFLISFALILYGVFMLIFREDMLSFTSKVLAVIFLLLAINLAVSIYNPKIKLKQIIKDEPKKFLLIIFLIILSIIFFVVLKNIDNIVAIILGSILMINSVFKLIKIRKYENYFLYNTLIMFILSILLILSPIQEKINQELIIGFILIIYELFGIPINYSIIKKESKLNNEKNIIEKV